MSKRRKQKKTALILACENISKYCFFRDQRQTPEFLAELFKKQATIPEGMEILEQLKDWVENNGDKKMSTYDFIIDLLKENGVEVNIVEKEQFGHAKKEVK